MGKLKSSYENFTDSAGNLGKDILGAITKGSETLLAMAKGAYAFVLTSFYVLKVGADASRTVAAQFNKADDKEIQKTCEEFKKDVNLVGEHGYDCLVASANAIIGAYETGVNIMQSAGDSAGTLYFGSKALYEKGMEISGSSIAKDLSLEFDNMDMYPSAIRATM